MLVPTYIHRKYLLIKVYYWFNIDMIIVLATAQIYDSNTQLKEAYSSVYQLSFTLFPEVLIWAPYRVPLIRTLTYTEKREREKIE